MRRRLLIVFFATCVFGLISTIFLAQDSISVKFNLKIVNESIVLSAAQVLNYTIVDYKNTKTDNTKFVLFFTSYYSWREWGLSADTINKYSEELANCSINNCVFTSNRKYFKKIHEFDVLIFHESSYAWYYREELRQIDTRSPQQLYVVAAHE